MKHSRIGALLALSLTLTATSAFAGKARAGAAASAAEIAGLRAASAQWIADVNSRDVARGMVGMTDDAAIIAPDGVAARGREQLAEYVSKLVGAPGFHVEFQPDSVTVSNDAKVGYVTGRSVISFTLPDGRLQSNNGRLLTIWRKAANGRWLCHLDVVMGNP